LFESEFFLKKEKKKGNQRLLTKKSKNHTMLEHTHLETPYSYKQKRPKKSLFLSVFSKGNKSHNLQEINAKLWSILGNRKRPEE
jgi:hypothetical protein